MKSNKPVGGPTGSLLYRLMGMLSIPELGGVQTTWAMASVDECITHRSWGLYESSSSPSQSYGPRFRFNEYMRAKGLMRGILIKVALASVGLLLAIPPIRWILTPLIKKFIIQAPGQGPNKESMKGDFLSYKAFGVAEDGKGQVGAKLDVAHGAYVATAMTLAAAANVILRGRLEETEAGRLGGGVLTPATLGDEYVKSLNEIGVKISIDA